MAEPITIGAITAGVAVVLGYGKLQQQVTNNKEKLEGTATAEKLDFVHEALDGRLERIEHKLDTMNGNG